MSGETKRAERTGTNEQRDKAGGTAERMDKRTVGRADRADRTDGTDGTDGQEAKQPNEWTNGRMDERTEQDRAGQNRQNRTNKQRNEVDRQSRQTADTSHRHSEDSQNTGLNHVAGEKKTTIPPRRNRTGAKTGSRNREQIGRKWRPGADRTKADRPKRRYGISGRLFRYVRRR